MTACPSYDIVLYYAVCIDRTRRLASGGREPITAHHGELSAAFATQRGAPPVAVVVAESRRVYVEVVEPVRRTRRPVRRPIDSGSGRAGTTPKLSVRQAARGCGGLARPCPA